MWRRGERGREEEEGQAGEKKGKERKTEKDRDYRKCVCWGG